MCVRHLISHVLLLIVDQRQRPLSFFFRKKKFAPETKSAAGSRWHFPIEKIRDLRLAGTYQAKPGTVRVSVNAGFGLFLHTPNLSKSDYIPTKNSSLMNERNYA
jgi:hypothetical protein